MYFLPRICRVVPMEEEGRAVNRGAALAAGALKKPLIRRDGSERTTSPPSPMAGQNNALHRGLSGHRAVRETTSDPLPETVREGARSTPLQEALASVPSACSSSYSLNPFYPLFVAYRRRHGATRIKVDLYLHYYNRGFKDAIQLYIDEMGFSEKSATGQGTRSSRRYGTRRSYFTTYYYGMKRIEETKPSTATIISHSLSLFAQAGLALKLEAFLKPQRGRRKRFLTRFDSLLPRG